MLFEPVPEGHRSGYVALVGAPNVGKSTLLNRLLGTKLSIVSAKPSTTRHRVLGILSADAAEGPDGHPPYQIVFVDTPGVVRPRYRLHDHMMADVDRALGDADVAVLLADATEKTPTHDARTPRAPRHGASASHPRPEQERPHPQRGGAPARGAVPLRAPDAPLEDAFAEVIPLSALNGKGMEAVAPAASPSAHPTTRRTSSRSTPSASSSARSYARPSSTATATRSPTRPRSTWCSTRSGPAARTSSAARSWSSATPRRASSSARAGSAQGARRRGAPGGGGLPRKPVFLQLHVKTRADWRNRDGFLRSFGYGS